MTVLDTSHLTNLPQSEANPFYEARARLNLSQRELAEKLHTSLYALTRWESGDLEPSPDALTRLRKLLSPASQENDPQKAFERDVVFASSGARTKVSALPLFPTEPTRMLDNPRETLLEEMVHDNFWGDGDIALADVLARRDVAAPTLNTALDEEVSAGKNTYTYDAHTYHTKVPPQGIANVIAKYLPEGGVTLDPFAGSGMTGVAARYLGCDVVLNELSPAASFISHNFMQNIEVEKFSQATAQIMKHLTPLRNDLYQTKCRECKKPTELQFSVWSYQLECNHCEKTFVLWDHCRKYGKSVREHKLLKKFPCPHCGEEVNKSYLKRIDPIPVFVGYKCCSTKIVEHPLEQYDFECIQRANAALDNFRNDFPKLFLPDGVNLSQPKRHGINKIEDFYTARNLIACAAIWREIRRIEDPELASAVGFAFTSLYQRVTRMSEYRFWGGSGNTANFNIPQISNETNVFVTFERKVKSISDHFATTAKNYAGRSVVHTGTATNLDFLPDNSIDFIFTDPPFGANINYSEMNVLWEAWLDKFTDAKDEVIMNRSQCKGIEEYGALMKKSLEEAYRVLRPNHWMVLVFMNSSQKVWGALRDAVEGAGFEIKKINVFDKQHGTFKQFVSDNAAGADLMLHCRKVDERSFDREGIDDETLNISKFLGEQVNTIPITPFLHIQRDAEIDYRTLYSRYIASAIKQRQGIVDFSKFRRDASEILERH